MIVFRRICIFVILSLLVFTSVWHYFKVKNAVFDLTNQIESIEKDISEDKLDELIKSWSAYQKKLSCTFEHNYLDDITKSMYSLKALYFQKADSIYSVLYEIKWSVSNMLEMQKINLGNLF